MSEMLEKLENIYKAAATDFKISGNLTDQQTEAWFTHVFEKGQFLSKVSRRLRSVLSGNTGFIAGSDEGFIEGTEGTEPADQTVHAQTFSQYLLRKLMLPAFVGYSVIDDNPEHGLLDKINDVNDQTAANSLQNLCINGISDAGGTFFNLMKGWIQLAKESVTIKKVSLVANDPRYDDLDALVEEMMLELPQENRGENVRFVCSDNERRTRNARLVQNSNAGAEAIAIAAMTEEMKWTIGGVKVECPHKWPDGFFFLGDPENLEVDIHRTVRRTIEENPRKGGFDYTYRLQADCEIIHHEEACVAYE